MKELEQRVAKVVGALTQNTPWERLIFLYRTDKDAFFRLACEGASPEAPRAILDLAFLASQLRQAVREGFAIEDDVEGATLTTASGVRVAISTNLVDQVTRFLREIDGKQTENRSGKDYEGEEIGESEVVFRLGERTAWSSDHVKLQEAWEAKPLVFTVSEEDMQHLVAQPAFVTHNLLQCARKTVMSPTVVFRGLKRGDGASPKVDGGWAFVGKPSMAYENDGTAIAPPNGMVFVVYIDEDSHVFDWDWVEESPTEPGAPVDWRRRFDKVIPDLGDADIDLPTNLQAGRFDQSAACYSGYGDCIFCYITDEESYAERINTDLTVFRAIASKDVSGFKVKNVRRILQADQSILIAQDLAVSVDSVLLATLKLHPTESVQLYQVLIQALYRRAGELPPQVRVPPELTAAA